MLFSVLRFLVLILVCLFSVAFFTLLERKLLGLVGLRVGPYKVSYGGLFQPIGDAGKLLNKESNSLSNFSFLFYYASSFLIMACRVFLFSFICLNSFSFHVKSGVLIVLIILGFNRLNSILSGWSTYRKFSLLGSLRTVSQLVSYEAPLYIALFFLISLIFSFEFNDVLNIRIYLFLILPLVFLFWLVCVLAELNRSPYDFSEGESELVRGFNVEFGSSAFTIIFLAEYGNIFFFIYVTRVIFFTKASIFWVLLFIFILWIRSVVPRYRFDKLIGLSWKVLIPQLGLFLIIYLFFIL